MRIIREMEGLATPLRIEASHSNRKGMALESIAAKVESNPRAVDFGVSQADRRQAVEVGGGIGEDPCPVRA